MAAVVVAGSATVFTAWDIYGRRASPGLHRRLRSPGLQDRRQPHPGAADGDNSGQPSSRWPSQAGLHRHARLRRKQPRGLLLGRNCCMQICCRACRGVAKGLASLHKAEMPVIYWDFKASNIMLESVSTNRGLYPFGQYIDRQVQPLLER